MAFCSAAPVRPFDLFRPWTSAVALGDLGEATFPRFVCVEAAAARPQDVRLDGSHVDVDLVLTTGWCPFVASMSSAIPDRLKRLDGVETVDVKVVWDPVWTMDRLSDSAREKLAMPLEELEPYRAGRSAG